MTKTGWLTVAGALGGAIVFAVLVVTLDVGAICLPSNPPSCWVNWGVAGLYTDTTDGDLAERLLWTGVVCGAVLLSATGALLTRFLVRSTNR